MAIFRVYFSTNAETYRDVEIPDSVADDPDFDKETIVDLAYSKDFPVLCGNCEAPRGRPGISIGEFELILLPDGTAEIERQ